MLLWIFGSVKNVQVEKYTSDHAAGFLQLERASVKWFLSINEEHLPNDIKIAGKRTFRSLKMNGDEIEFSDGFTDLHTASYRDILNGRGFGLADARPSIELVHQIRTLK
jgi:UDP-N-acetyl-2-amino-2-deoxyglucuronate dehydrogenase